MSTTTGRTLSNYVENAKVDEQNKELNEIENEKSSAGRQMVIAQMAEEKIRLIQEGKCFFCKEIGHLARGCPLRKGKIQQRYDSHLKGYAWAFGHVVLTGYFKC